MQIVIICGGLATRLGSVVENIPKSMIRINGKPFLEHQIEQLKKQKLIDIVLCVGHLSEQIEDYFGSGKKFGVNISYGYDKEKPLGPIGAVKNAEPILKDTFFTMYGDSYVFVDYNKVYSYFKDHDKLALMTVYKNFDKYDKSNIIVDKENVVRYGGEKTKDMNYIDYGVSLFKKRTLNLLSENTFFSTNDSYTMLVKQNELLAYEIKKRFYHIGTPESLKEFTKYIEKQ